jgi:hypothetical protein
VFSLSRVQDQIAFGCLIPTPIDFGTPSTKSIEINVQAILGMGSGSNSEVFMKED